MPLVSFTHWCLQGSSWELESAYLEKSLLEIMCLFKIWLYNVHQCTVECSLAIASFSLHVTHTISSSFNRTSEKWGWFRSKRNVVFRINATCSNAALDNIWLLAGLLSMVSNWHLSILQSHYLWWQMPRWARRLNFSCIKRWSLQIRN